MRHHALHLFIGNERALAAGRLAGAVRMKQHIAAAEQLFGARCVENDAAVDRRADRKRAPRGDVRLDEPRDDIRARTLRCDDQMDARGTAELRDAADRIFDVLGRDHHQVGKLIDDDHELAHALFRIVDRGIVAGELARADFAELAVPLRCGSVPNTESSTTFGSIRIIWTSCGEAL